MPSFTYNVPEISPARLGPAVAVFRYAPQIGFQPLTTVKCLEVSFREGPDPSKAVFQYVTGNYLTDMVTLGFENLLPFRRIGNPYVVDTDDELVVATMTPGGRFRYLFHGYAQVPEVSITDKTQDMQFSAQGVEMRCWHDPIRYREQRDAADPGNLSKNTLVGLDVHFNPKVNHITTGNMLTAGNDWEAVNKQNFKYCNFIDQYIDKTINVNNKPVKVRSLWTLYNVINYLFCVENVGWKYIRTWEPPVLKKLLATYTPKKGDYFDINDPTTYTMSDPNIADVDVRGEPWPVAADKILRSFGFATCFRLGDDGQWPVTWMDVYKLNEGSWTKYKDLYLQKWYDELDPAMSNVQNVKLAGDISGIVNVVSVDTAPVRHEAGFILAGLFDTLPTDVANKATFDKTLPASKDYADKYRSFGFDECGEGHLKPEFAPPDAKGVVKFASLTHVTDVADLAPLFGKDANGKPLWTARRRPPFNELWTKDVKGAYLQKELYISYDYSGPVPAIWDGTAGTWHKVNRGFELQKDRLGIIVTEQKANEWQAIKPAKGQPVPQVFGGGLVKTVEWMGTTGDKNPTAFTLMLLCVVEADQHLDVQAPRRPVSPTNFNVNTVVDLRSKLRPGSIHSSSMYHFSHVDPNAPKAPIETGNEKADALKYAETKREANQLGKFAGSVDIPRLTLAYIVGDRIRKVVGRDADLQINRDANGREAPTYPRVVGITYRLSGGIHTQLVLSDTRSDSYGI